MMKRCGEAAEGFECVKFEGHHGSCQCVTTKAFQTSMQVAEDEFLYGTRIDPNKLIIMARRTGKQGLHKLLIDAYTQGLVKS